MWPWLFCLDCLLGNPEDGVIQFHVAKFILAMVGHTFHDFKLGAL